MEKAMRYLGIVLFVMMLLSGCRQRDIVLNDSKDEISKVLLLEMDTTKTGLCVITDLDNNFYARRLVPNRYLVLKEKKWKRERFRDMKGVVIFNYSYSAYNIQVYSVDTRELVKTYTLKEMEAALPKGYRIYQDFKPESLCKDGQDYLLFSAVKYEKNPEEQYERKCLTINLDTDEMKFWEEISFWGDIFEDSERAQIFENQLDVFWEWTEEEDWYQFFKANGFLPLFYKTEELQGKKFCCTTGSYLFGYRNEGIAEIRIMTDSLPKENTELYQKFPSLKQYQGKEGLIANIFLGNFPSSEEIFRLLLEEGQEISFAGCVMDGAYSKDGQPHEIGSFEQFEQWYQPKQK